MPHQEHWNEVFPLEHRDLAYGWALAVGNRVLFGEEGRPDSDFFLILFCDRLRCATLRRQAERQRMSLAVVPFQRLQPGGLTLVFCYIGVYPLQQAAFFPDQAQCGMVRKRPLDRGGPSLTLSATDLVARVREEITRNIIFAKKHPRSLIEEGGTPNAGASSLATLITL